MCIFYHAINRNMEGRGGVTISIKKRVLKRGKDDVEVIYEDTKEGRVLIIKIKGMMDKDLIICGMYASTNAAERKQWMGDVLDVMVNDKRMKMEDVYYVMVGDLNFVKDTRWDKKNGNKTKGMEGKKEEEEWERVLGVRDVWRERNRGMLGTTWTERTLNVNAKPVRTRIDRWLVDERLIEDERVIGVEIKKTTVSDHDAITCRLRVNEHKQKRSYEKLPLTLLDDDDYCETVKKIYEEEKNSDDDILVRHERMKARCMQEAMRRTKKWKRKEKKKKNELKKKIELMNRVVQWTENAVIQRGKGKKIKRWKRGIEMIRQAKLAERLKKKLRETELEEIDKEANKYFRELTRKKEEGDEERKRIEKKIAKLAEIDEDERNTSAFYKKAQIGRKKETIEELAEKIKQLKGKQEIEIEITHTDEKEKQRIAKDFYKELWRKRETNKEIQDELIEKITNKLSDKEKKRCEGRITLIEISESKKKMKKNKTAGIDGIPAEFWQKFDFLDEWLQRVYTEILTRKRMTDTMRMAVVKLLHKKNDKKQIANYRPISLLTTDYKLLAKITTERMKDVLNTVIANDQQDS